MLGRAREARPVGDDDDDDDDMVDVVVVVDDERVGRIRWRSR